MGEFARVISETGTAFAEAFSCADVLEEVCRIYAGKPDISGEICGGLAQTAVAAALIGALMKNEGETVTLNFRGLYIAAADSWGNVKCRYCGNDSGNDFMTLVRDTGFGEPYVTRIAAENSISETITAYYAYSAQIPTACSIGNAGGYLVQILPPVDEEAVRCVERNIAEMGTISPLLKSNLTAEDIAVTALGGLSPNVLDKWEAGYFCGCSREKTRGILAGLPENELQAELRAAKNKSADGKLEIKCDYCGKKYYFSKDELVG